MKTVKLHPDKISYYLFWLVIITLPLPMILNNIAIILFSAYSIIITLNTSRLRFDLQSLFFPILFLTAVISLIYVGDFYKGLKSLEKILAFILFFTTLNSSSFTKEESLKLLRGFAYINVILIATCIIIALFYVFKNNSFIIYNPENFVNENYFLYHRFSTPIGFHAIYLGIYSVFSICILVFDLKNQKKKIYYFLMLFLLFSGVILLKSFAVLVSSFIILFFYYFYFNPIKLNKSIGLILISVLLIALSSFYYKAKGFNKTVFHYNLQDDVHNPNWNSLNIRLAKWECALELYKKNKLFGVGVGAGQTELNHIYQEKGFVLGLKNKFSTHNQYLHYLVELGIIGAAIFIIGLILNLYKSIKDWNFLFFALIVLLSVCSVTENVLTLNKGIVFFAIFYFLTLRFNFKD